MIYVLAFLSAVALTHASQEEVSLTPRDFQNAKLIPERPNSLKDPMAEGRVMFEGDINLGGLSVQEYIVGVGVQHDDNAQHNGLRASYRRWSDGVIPYTVSSSFDKYERSRIAKAISKYHLHTCIRWVPRTSQRDYVYIFRDEGHGCYSTVGKWGGGRQTLSLDHGCMGKGTILHEMMHAAGFFHEQSRNDRDDYIEIIERNMIPGKEGQFQKYSLNKITHLDTSYDYGSIMHYSQYAFSKNGRPTIRAKTPGATFGQRRKLSQNDILKLNTMYGCSGGAVTTEAPPNPVTPEPTGCKDDHLGCEFWADMGLCKDADWRPQYPKYVRKTCRKSCRLCW